MRSFSMAIDELLRAYWSPTMARIQIQEKFHELNEWLLARELLTDRAEQSLQLAQAHVFQGIAEEKKLDQVIKGDFK